MLYNSWKCLSDILFNLHLIMLKHGIQLFIDICGVPGASDMTLDEFGKTSNFFELTLLSARFN